MQMHQPYGVCRAGDLLAVRNRGDEERRREIGLQRPGLGHQPCKIGEAFGGRAAALCAQGTPFHPKGVPDEMRTESSRQKPAAVPQVTPKAKSPMILFSQ